jgi:flagellar assembly protein FliH
MIEKFTFNHDFEKPKPIDENAPKYTEDQVIAMRELAYSKGIDEGKNTQQHIIEADLTRALAGFEEQLVNFVNLESEKRAIIHAEAAQLAKIVALKICLTEAEKNSVDRVVTCMEKVTQTLLGKPTMSIVVNPQISQSLSERIKDLIANGEIQIKTDDSLSVMDCRFSWASGGAEVVLKNTLDEVDRLINEISHTKEI